MSIKIFSVAEMIAAEKAADAAGISYDQMMESAGKAVADAIIARYPIQNTRILILVGPGNNGGDGLVAGRYLAEAGADVAFYLYKPRHPETDPNFARVQAMGLFIAEWGQDQRARVLRTRLNITDLVIDALLGTGVSRPIGGELAKLMQQVRNGLAARRRTLTTASPFATLYPTEETPPPAAPPVPVVAVDCPSGLN
ncbi:MAG: hypothetical protein D6706_16075, partial [Chloroflexi bacterium]